MYSLLITIPLNCEMYPVVPKHKARDNEQPAVNERYKDNGALRDNDSVLRSEPPWILVIHADEIPRKVYMPKQPYAAQSSQNMFMPHLDAPEKLSYGQKMYTVHCDPGATISRKHTVPSKFIGISCARESIKRAGNPTRRQRREAHELREAIAKERTWLR